MMRVVLDANVVISGTIAPKGKPAAILDAWRADYFEVVTCPELMAEIVEKLRLPRIRDKYHVTERDVVNLVLAFSQIKLLVPGSAAISPPPPDPKDRMLFSAAVEADAHYIITGDKPLLDFKWNGPGRIVNPKQFWETEFPQQFLQHLGWPLLSFEDLPGVKQVYVIDPKGGRYLALFTTQQAAETYRRKNSIVVDYLVFEQASELAEYLKLLDGCQGVVFNPIGQDQIAEPIDEVLRVLEKQTGQKS